MKRAFVRFPTTIVLAGACLAMTLAGCSKHSDSQTTTTTTDTSTTAAAAATSASDAAAATAASSPAGTTMTAATPAGEAGAATTPVPAPSGGFSFIDIPVYPGAKEDPSQHMSMTSGDGSLEMHVYATKDDTKTVAEWYKSHLPASWKNTVITANDKTVGTFVQEQIGVGDQSVMVGDNNGATRIQITTKKGK